jgi:hypothetical protein
MEDKTFISSEIKQNKRITIIYREFTSHDVFFVSGLPCVHHKCSIPVPITACIPIVSITVTMISTISAITMISIVTSVAIHIGTITFDMAFIATFKALDNSVIVVIDVVPLITPDVLVLVMILSWGIRQINTTILSHMAILTTTMAYNCPTPPMMVIITLITLGQLPNIPSILVPIIVSALVANVLTRSI